MTLMQDLVLFASDKQLRPDAAVEQLVAEYDKGGNLQMQQQQGGMSNGVQQNAGGTPRMGNMPGPPGFQGSPSIQFQNLPNGMNGSPHLHGGGLAPGQMGTPSPAQNPMAAPPMVPQHSQQGTSSSAASANTSPQVNNKRRRSTVKMEGEEGDGGGGQKVKPSPRMGKKAKPS